MLNTLEMYRGTNKTVVQAF